MTSDLPEKEVDSTRESKDFPNYYPMKFEELWDGVAPGDRFLAVQDDQVTLAVVTWLDRIRKVAYVAVDWPGLSPRK